MGQDRIGGADGRNERFAAGASDGPHQRVASGSLPDASRSMLLIAYYYPPMNNGGVQRPLKMARYLPRFGYRVSVVTSSFAHRGLTRDPDGNLRIYDVSRRGMNSLTWLRTRIAQRLRRLFRRSYESAHQYWLAEGRRHGDSLMETIRPDVIVATYPPHETLELGLFLAREYEVPLVPDFRDGMMFETIQPALLEDPLARAHLTELETEVVSHASAIVTVSEPISDYFRRAYTHPNVHTVTNGFDPEELLGSNEKRSPVFDSSKLNIVYTGRLSLSDSGIESEPFFESVMRLWNDCTQARERLRLHFVGEFTRAELCQMRPLQRVGALRLEGSVPRERALELQRQADALLLFTDPERTSIVTGKLFEYLQAGKPVIGLTHESYAAMIIAETNGGWTVHPRDREGIASLLRMLVTGSGTIPRPDENAITRYARPVQMQRFAGLLDEVTGGTKGAGGEREDH